MPLVINSLGGGHIHTYTQTDVRTKTIQRNQVHTGRMSGLNNRDCKKSK